MDSKDKEILIKDIGLSKLKDTNGKLSELGKLAEKLKVEKPNLRQFDVFTYDLQMENMRRQIEKANEELSKSLEEQYLKEEKFKQDVLETLMKIERNTGEISNLVFMVQRNNRNQSEIIEILKQILEISTSKTEEEADNRYREIMDKATKLKTDVETITKLIKYAEILWIAVKEFLKNPL